MWSHKTYERIFKISTFLYHDLRPDGIVFNKLWFLYGILIRILGLLAFCFITNSPFSNHHTVAMTAYEFVSSTAGVIEIYISAILFSKSRELARVMHYCWKCHMSSKVKKYLRQTSFLKHVLSTFTIDILLFSLLAFSMTIVAIIFQDNFPTWFTTAEFSIAYGMTLIFQTTLKMIPILFSTFFLFLSNAMNYKTNQLVKLVDKIVIKRHLRTSDVSLYEAAMGYEDFLLNVRVFYVLILEVI